MKRKHPNTIPMEEMTQDLLDKAYSCEMSKEQLLKMFSDCIEKKWMEEEEKFRKKDDKDPDVEKAVDEAMGK